jgi:hypothetical protein
MLGKYDEMTPELLATTLWSKLRIVFARMWQGAHQQIKQFANISFQGYPQTSVKVALSS